LRRSWLGAADQRLYGIVIAMYHNEIHHPGRPHFHARYGDDEASVDIEASRCWRASSRLAPRGSSSNGRSSTEPSYERTGTAPAATSHFNRSSPSDRPLGISPVRSTPLLIEASPRDGYTVHVRFEDGTSADVDLSYRTEYGGVFAPLRDLAFFRQLSADPELGTIVWPNDADIAPERLYAHARRGATTTA
jgi:hypothetical protein